MEHEVEILMSELVTHDVRRFIVSRPDGFSFEPGQGVEIALDAEGWREEGRPFTPTSLVDDRVLEFTIKEYPEHEGVTKRLHRAAAGDTLLMSGPFGTIRYRGPGVFIAGGAGLTPFLSIFRSLAVDGKLSRQSLLFSNKTRADVICEKELRHYLGDRCRLTLTAEDAPGYDRGRIDREYLDRVVEDFDQPFYVCGPPAMVDDLREALVELGASPDALVFEG